MAINEWSMPLEELKRAAFAPAPQVQAPPASVPQVLQQAINNFEQFKAMHPDFQNTEENAAVLGSYAADVFRTTGRIATPEDLRRAHALAIHDKRYTAAEPKDPYTMPLDQLGAMAGITGHQMPAEHKLPSAPDQSNTAAQLLQSEATSSEREVRAIQFAKENMPYISGRI